MQLTIHRGSHEIGGSCVELASNGRRIVIDIGMPLSDKEGGRFDLKKYKNHAPNELLRDGILPDVKGLYHWDDPAALIDGLLISHAHLDHYGLYKYLNKDINCYLSEMTEQIIHLSELFLNLDGGISHSSHFQSGKVFQIGPFSITPFLMDHSAFDAHAVLVEADGKRLLYSGDFREHGRKEKAFKWALHKIPRNIDALLIEGSLLGREDEETMTEYDVEQEIISIIRNTRTIVFGLCSSQNIDRLVSFFKSALETNRIFAIDVYTANILSTLRGSNNLPYPSKNFSNIRVFFPKRICDMLNKLGRKDLMYKFKDFRITKKEISERLNEIVMMVRPSMTFDMSHIKGIEGAPLIYSMWPGYLEDASMDKFKTFLASKGMPIIIKHSSGHATVGTLKKVVNTIRPKIVIPIHTYYPERYSDLFPDTHVRQLNDGQTFSI